MPLAYSLGDLVGSYASNDEIPILFKLDHPLHRWYSQEYLVFYLKMQLSSMFVSVTLLHVDSALLSLVFFGTIVELISQACSGSGTMWLGWVIWRLRLQSWASRIFWNWASRRIDWLHEVEWIFDYKEVPNCMEVKVVFIKQKGRTFAWCENLKRSRDKPGKSKIWAVYVTPRDN
jgi:hypothetical protein